MLGIIKHTILLLAAAVGVGCAGNENVTSVSATEFAKEIKADSVRLLDVRTPQEFAEGHIPGAININVQADDFRQVAERELSKAETVMVYCRSGRRSLTAAVILTGLGYKVVNLKGGITEWKADGFPVSSAGE